ncbi:putative regulatory protein, FmdB family [Abditibacterium utsteinense]|uniref:Putative regulatory protein, FmdB family n=1 Tax=Abditibacterium utsteinense TaxID=1960156 RepID=A0A2S8SXE0_9BACT|nr:FmdB family zinc ribbon protein [Abditibacterium utsteinense]PQV65419.1 putative regulatory protein, FmdB family [Abditibacterium utsteinense]
MPNYEYKCTQDGSRFEVWQEVGTPAPACPTCGAPSKKVFSPPRVHFKGSGFYLTDLRAEQSGGKNGAKTSESDSNSSSDAASASELKTDVKTEKADTKTETKSEAPVSKPGASGAKTE